MSQYYNKRAFARSASRVAQRYMELMFPAQEWIPGGNASGMQPYQFDPDAIAQGIDVEMEHTDNPDVAREIAMDHLTESSRYYDALEEMEADLEEEPCGCARKCGGKCGSGCSCARVASRYVRAHGLA